MVKSLWPHFLPTCGHISAFHYGTFMCKRYNTLSFIKPEAHIISQRRLKRTEPRPYVTRRGYFGEDSYHVRFLVFVCGCCRHLQADCQEPRDQLRNPALSNRVWATSSWVCLMPQSCQNNSATAFSRNSTFETAETRSWDCKEDAVVVWK